MMQRPSSNDGGRELSSVCSTIAQVVLDMGTSIDRGDWEAATSQAGEVEHLARVVGCFSQLNR
jgi:hypothetical protein